jgi:micrococcal nuclease
MVPFQYRGRVVRVIDGDSVEVDIDLGFHTWIVKRNVRLKNLDAEESRTRDMIEKQFGYLAKSVVEGLLPAGCNILIETDLDDEDKFGRVLGTIIAPDGTNVNEYMLDNRYATAYEGQSKDDIQAAHLANREYLIENGKIVLDPNFKG